MRQKIYLDVLFVLNVYVTFFLIAGTAKLISHKMKKWRYLVGSLLGGIYSLIIIFDLTTAELIVIKLLMGVSLVLTAFWRRDIHYLLKAGGAFFIVNFLFGGFMYCLWLFAAPLSMKYKNGVPYFNISALSLTIATIATYLIITLFCKLKNRRFDKASIHSIIITNDGREAIFTALEDTGNKLCDIFSGLPVIVCEYGAAKDLFPKKLEPFFQNKNAFDPALLENSEYKTKIKIIPVNTVSGGGALPAIKPDKILLDKKEVAAIVAVTNHLSDGSYNAICPSSLINT